MDFETRFPFVFYLLCKYRFRNWSVKDIRNYQKRKAESIVRYASNNSDFFRRWYSNYDVNGFYSLPRTNKKIMMDNLSEYNTLRLDKDELIRFALDVEKSRNFNVRFKGINIGMSSGTSGNKGIVITTKHEENYLKAMYASRLVFPKGEKLNAAFILRVSSPAFNYKRMGNKLTYISQLQPIESIVAELEKIRPNVLSAPPSMLKILAKEYLVRNLKIRPRSVYSYAEVLYPDVKLFLEKTFGCRIFEVYQGSEGCYATTCKEGNLHINEDMVLLELYDKNGKPTPDGKPCCKLLVTDLHKKSQPIIRYEINDIITISKQKCRCGSNFRVIEQIQGRADDLFWGIRKDNGEKHFIYQDYISRKIISVSENIEEFQAIQESYTRITLRIKLVGGNKEKIRKKLVNGMKKIFSAYNCLEPEVKIIFGNPKLNNNSQKLARVICKIKT